MRSISRGKHSWPFVRNRLWYGAISAGSFGCVVNHCAFFFRRVCWPASRRALGRCFPAEYRLFQCRGGPAVATNSESFAEVERNSHHLLDHLLHSYAVRFV